MSFLQVPGLLLITFDEQFLIISRKISFLRLTILTRHVLRHETKIHCAWYLKQMKFYRLDTAVMQHDATSYVIHNLARQAKVEKKKVM